MSHRSGTVETFLSRFMAIDWTSCILTHFSLFPSFPISPSFSSFVQTWRFLFPIQFRPADIITRSYRSIVLLIW